VAKEKQASGRYKKIYEKVPKTPCRRLLESPDLAEAYKAELRWRVALFNPATLKKHDGGEYRPKKHVRKVLDYDFPIKELGKIASCGVCNVNNNVGFVNVDTGCDTSEFAVESILRWWETLGKHTFPNAKNCI
jgi:hypothetical protein